MEQGFILSIYVYRKGKLQLLTMSIFCSLNEPRPLKTDQNLVKVVRINKNTIAEPQNEVEDVMEERTGLDEAKEAAPKKAKSKKPIKSTLLQPHKTVNSKKTRSVTFTDQSTKGTANVKAGEIDDLKLDDTDAIEEQNRKVEFIRAEIAKTEMRSLLSRSKNSLKVVLTKLTKERDQKW